MDFANNQGFESNVEGVLIGFRESCKHYGEVEKVLPDLVESSCGIKVFDKDDKLKRMEDEENTFLETDEYAKSIQINGLIPILVEAVKELSAKVTALENA